MVVVNLLCVSGSHKGYDSRIVPRILSTKKFWPSFSVISKRSHIYYILHTGIALCFCVH